MSGGLRKFINLTRRYTECDAVFKNKFISSDYFALLAVKDKTSVFIKFQYIRKNGDLISVMIFHGSDGVV